ncbi:hypothetical protein [Streptomyces sp. NPDC006134]|uniref:SCO2102 family sporulation regulator n=1 Tax=Streptomyces sp. NPDC006134 TaxID=3154467 RepID=UPI0033F2C6AC
MGWTVLYIAFGIVALWLLGEVLLQYKARLRWRLLAFTGFLGVVAGVLIPSVVVIALGAAAFAVGQTYVTLSFRRGFAAGWAVSAPKLTGDRRRRAGRGRQEPTLEVSGVEAAEGGYGDDGRAQADDRVSHGHDGYGGHDGHDDYDSDDVFTPARPAAPTAAETTAVYEPLPLPDDTGAYGLYGGPGHSRTADRPYAYDPSGQGGHGYGYDTVGDRQYAAYSDPYIGTHTYGGAPYDTGYGDRQGYGQDPYATGGHGQTPPGGVWVPQQRSTDEPYGAELPQEQQPYPYHGGGQPQAPGYDEQQYRY